MPEDFEFAKFAITNFAEMDSDATGYVHLDEVRRAAAQAVNPEEKRLFVELQERYPQILMPPGFKTALGGPILFMHMQNRGISQDQIQSQLNAKYGAQVWREHGFNTMFNAVKDQTYRFVPNVRFDDQNRKSVIDP